MRIIGITYPSDDGTLQTILVRSSPSMLDASIRRILPWFFNHTIPLFGILTESSVALRLQTKTDPFRHLRGSKCPPFDGKGFTLQRSVRHGGLVRIDDGLKIAIDDFNKLCPGLFYGTVKYPSLNILLSLRRFRKYVVCPSKLWSVLYDCLLCRQFNERQQTDGDFKLEMRQLFHTTQLQDFRPQIAELQERIELSNQYSNLKNSLQQLCTRVHSEQVQRYRSEVKQLKLMLRNAGIEKRQLLANQVVRDMDINLLMDREIAAIRIMVMKSELENLLIFCQAELNEAEKSLEVRSEFETTLEELKKSIIEIENVVSKLKSIEFLELEVENVRCSIENNQSFMMLLKIRNEYERKIYISYLQMHKQSIKNSIRSAVADVNREKGKLASSVDQMHKFKNLSCSILSAANDDDSSCVELIDQLQNTLVEIVETTNKITALENENSNLQHQIWRNYLEEIPSIPFTELLAIAAVQIAVDLSDVAVKEDFLGFLYDRALDTGIRAKWSEGLSCAAIFRTENSVAHVKRVIEQEKLLTVRFPYFVLETRVRNSLHNFLRKNVPEEDGGGTVNYEETVKKVNTVVERLVAQLQTNRKSHEAGEYLKILISNKHVLLTDLDGFRNGSRIQWPRLKFQDLPSLINCYITANNHETRLQARYDSLDKFITQIENNAAVPLLNENQLKDEVSRLNGELETLLQAVSQNKTSYYNGLKELTAKCDTVQFALERFFVDEDCCPILEGMTSAVYRKLIDCWTNCIEAILRAITAIDQMANIVVPAEVERDPVEIDELIQQIQSLDLQEKSLATCIASTENMLEDYCREKGFSSFEDKKLSHFTLARQRPVEEIDKMMENIVATQLQLQQLPPGYSSARIGYFKSKVKYLTVLEQERSEARDMCFNNLILPIIDKLHVQKLRQMCQLVSSISEDLPEMGGTVHVSFEYETPEMEDNERNDYSQISFSLHRIKAVHIHILENDNVEVSLNETQQHIAYLILFLSFLYCDGCKIVLLDKACEQLFDNGIVSLFYVLEKYFPSMQFIFL
ncbi:uncharacterized protein LOC126556929 [Anopheles maculipalpis]|uniref:uncharacterized protein LOC126556929 n=1 Tax=Anopheles maculipalpis TaxID=1496333 RepID=UPI0021599DC5|nr:uncharacterized protein LOC126556929 [Anopheles maculipalpis]